MKMGTIQLRIETMEKNMWDEQFIIAAGLAIFAGAVFLYAFMGL